MVKARNLAVSAQGVAAQVASRKRAFRRPRQAVRARRRLSRSQGQHQFLELQKQLDDIENKLAAARRFFNSAAAEYNASRESFPAMLVASSLGFHPQTFFDIGEDKRQEFDAAPPPVKF